MSLAPLMSSAKQDWRTPKALFDTLSSMAGGFNLDAAADSSNTLCDVFFSERYSAFDHNWDVWPETRAFLNPPYGKALARFSLRAVEQVSLERRKVEVWLLVPARVDTRWWNLMITKAVSVRFMAGRVKFEREDGARDAAPFPTAVIQLRHDGGNPSVVWGWRP